MPKKLAEIPIPNELQESHLYKGPLKSAVETARHYGFTLIEPITITKRLPNTLTKAKKESLKEKDFSDFPKDYMSVLKKYVDDEMFSLAQPVMITHVIDRADDLAELRLEIIGTRKSVAEATVIKTASIILNDLGYKETSLRINCLGDKESGNGFLKELTNYYRDHVSNFSPTLQQQLKKDILRIYTNQSEKYKEINENAPRPVGFLSEESRLHFKELIEFIENLGLDYEIDEKLVGCSSCLPKTTYEILDSLSKDGETLARGERHNYLAQNIGLNKKVPIVGIGINIKRKDNKKDEYSLKNSTRTPKIYFIHLGFDAKKRSLGILETFRKSGVPVYQSLCNDSFSHQLRRAESAKVPYTMIIGQKEVFENSIIFRDMETRYQEKVDIGNLERFLYSLKKRKVI